MLALSIILKYVKRKASQKRIKCASKSSARHKVGLLSICAREVAGIVVRMPEYLTRHDVPLLSDLHNLTLKLELL